MEFAFYLPTKVHFGQGKVKKVGKIAKKYGEKALVVTGRTSARKLGFLELIEKELKKEGVKFSFFEKIEPNPSIDTVKKGAEFFKQERCDMIIALGGGSSLDAAKVIGIMVKNPAPLSSYFGKNKVKEEIPPLIAIPTTSGTGSEVTPYAVITDTENDHVKKVIADPHLFPKEALLDPELTITLPPSVTSDTGIDALSHAVESYLSKKSFPLSQTIALEAIRIIGIYLPRAVKRPDDLEARTYLMYASLLAGMVIAQTGATILHTMGYPLTSNFNIPHGRVNGILLPPFWEKSFSGEPEKFSKVVASLLEGIENSQAKDPVKSALFIKEFLHKAGLPKNPNINIKEEELSRFAHEIIKNKEKIAVSPKELNFEEILDIYKKALLH